MFDGDDSYAELDQWVADAKDKAERYQAMQAQVQQVSVTESSRDGVATVTVDFSGNVTDLRFTDQAQEMTGKQLSASVLAAMRTAQARLPERLGEVMHATIGDDTQTIDTIVGGYQTRFPDPNPTTAHHDLIPEPTTAERLLNGFNEDE